MMSSFIDFLSRRLHYRGYLDPARDWLVLLSAAGIILAGVIVWNIWTFDVIARGGAIGAPVVEAPPVFSRTSLDAIHTVFDSRANEEAKYETGTYRYSDPSQ